MSDVINEGMLDLAFYEDLDSLDRAYFEYFGFLVDEIIDTDPIPQTVDEQELVWEVIDELMIARQTEMGNYHSVQVLESYS